MERVFDRDALIESGILRDINPPTSYRNLATGPYYGGGNIRAKTYTRYYFSPNADGCIYVTASFDWGTDFAYSDKAMWITCYELGNGDVVRYNVPGGTDKYGVINSGRIRFSNLDVNKFYYFSFEKTYDAFYADLDVKIAHS